MLSAKYVLGLALAIGQAQALYFYMDGTAPKCFYEDLPKDTLVLGASKRNANPAVRDLVLTTVEPFRQLQIFTLE
jgi:hypothetical protein